MVNKDYQWFSFSVQHSTQEIAMVSLRRSQIQNTSHSENRAPSSKTRRTLPQLLKNWTDRQTDRRTDTRPLHRPCSAYNASSVKNDGYRNTAANW